MFQAGPLSLGSRHGGHTLLWCGAVWFKDWTNCLGGYHGVWHIQVLDEQFGPFSFYGGWGIEKASQPGLGAVLLTRVQTEPSTARVLTSQNYPHALSPR